MEGLTSTKAKLLITLLDMEEKFRTTTHIAQLYGVSKSTISRAADWCEDNNLIQRKANRTLSLTNYGRKKSSQLMANREIVSNWCRACGISQQNAVNDCELLYFNCSQEMLNIFQKQCVMADAKKELVKRQKPTSSHFCRAIPNGEYSVPFAFYKHKSMGRGELSMANEGFIHPAHIRIQDSDGTIILRATKIQRRSFCSGCTMVGTVQSVRYKKDGMLVEAVKVGGEFTLPIDIIKFVSIADDVANGVTTLSINSTVGNIHMPESEVDLELLI
mgnify:CR=1 FL=1